jgi:hypothetical protein
MKLLDHCKSFLGRKLETLGPNRGPWIDTFKRFVSPYLVTSAPGIPWCGCFAFWGLGQVSGMQRKQLSAALGFPEPWYPESADSWLHCARKQTRADGAHLVQTPLENDLFLWLRRKEVDGRVVYDVNDAIHIGFVHKAPTALGARFPTLEGNTCPETSGDARSSREGDGAYLRSRPWSRGGMLFIRLPDHLKDGN